MPLEGSIKLLQLSPEFQLKNTEVEVDSWQCDNWEAWHFVGHHHQRLEAHVHGHGGGGAEHEHDDVDELVEEEVEEDEHGAHAEDEEDDQEWRHVDRELFFLAMSVLKKGSRAESSGK